MAPMASKKDDPTLSFGTVSRVTGLSPDVLRAWERRYEAVVPMRTPGGTRRYTPSQVQRLRLLKNAVDAGHRIGDIVQLSDDALSECVVATRAPRRDSLAAALEIASRLDAPALWELLCRELDRLGPADFVRDVTLPLLQDVGDRWATGSITIAGEHLVTATLRTLLGSWLQDHPGDASVRPLLFSTPPGETHEISSLAAAVFARASGATVVYLGPDLPSEELASAARTSRAQAVVLGIAHLPVQTARVAVERLGAQLPSDAELWVGGARTQQLASDRVTWIRDFDDLKTRVMGQQADDG